MKSAANLMTPNFLAHLENDPSPPSIYTDFHDSLINILEKQYYAVVLYTLSVLTISVDASAGLSSTSVDAFSS